MFINKEKKDKTKSKNYKDFIVNMALVVCIGIAFLPDIAASSFLQPAPNVKQILRIISLIFRIIIFVILYIRSLKLDKETLPIWLKIMVFPANAVLYLLVSFVSNDIPFAIAFLLNATAIIIVAIKYFNNLSINKNFKFEDKFVFYVPIFLIIITFLQATYRNYINNVTLFCYSLVPTALFLVLFFVVMLVKYKKLFKPEKGSTKFATIVLGIIFCFVVGVTTIDVINTTNAPKTSNQECLVVEKISSGGRKMKFYLHVILDGKEVSLIVDLDTYNSTEINDYIKISYSKGNLNIPYYES